MKAIQLLSCNKSVQYNKVILIERSTFLETFKQFLIHYTPEIEFHQNQHCEQILTQFFEIIEGQTNGIYRFCKFVFDYQENIMVRLTKRLLLGPEHENTFSEMPSMLLVNSQNLAIRIFLFISSMAESGLTEMQHFVSVMDV